MHGARCVTPSPQVTSAAIECTLCLHRWIAAPELYPTDARGLGANTAFLANVLGSVPASTLVYSSVLPRWAVAASIGFANIAAGLLALALPETAGVNLE